MQQPRLAEDRDDGRLRGHELAEVRVVAGLVGPVPGRPEGRQLRLLPAHRPGGREEVDVLRVGARPAALDERHPELVEHAGDAQLVREREGDVLALGPVAERGVVEDDRLVGHAVHSRGCRERLDDRGRERGRADDRRGRRAGRPDRPGRPCASRRRARARRRPRSPTAASSRPSDIRSSIAAERIVPIGLATSWPAMSGAEPWIGSYSPNVPCAVRRSPSDADGSIPSEPGQHRRLVGQDVAEEVLGDDDVEVGRPPDEQHRARVDELVAERRRPGSRGATSSATVRHRRDVARTLALSTDVTCLRRVARELEREPDDPPRPRPPSTGSVSSAARVAGRARRLAPLAEVDAAGQLADDEHVDAGQQLRPERRGRDERRMDADGPQVRVQAEPAAKREERLLRPDRRRRIGPLRAADGAQQDRVGLAARGRRPRARIATP